MADAALAFLSAKPHREELDVAPVFPPLYDDYEPTRATLRAYARAVGAIARAHGVAHPDWWHTSLQVRPEGLATDPIPLPEGEAFAVTMDLRRHRAVLTTSTGEDRIFDLEAGMTATEFGVALADAAAALGLENPVERSRFEDDQPRVYSPDAASAYFHAFTAAAAVFERHRVTLGRPVGPVQVWPHGFDLAFEWFGTKMERHGDRTLPAQINLGFYPGGEPYFYSNPWPFDPALTGIGLPVGARWHTEGWQGAMLPYTGVQGDPDAAARITEFARVVHQAASPGLEAP
jgi:hypothetical protein